MSRRRTTGKGESRPNLWHETTKSFTSRVSEFSLQVKAYRNDRSRYRLFGLS